MFQLNPFARQRVHQRQYLFCCIDERANLGQLRANVAVHACDTQMWQALRLAIKLYSFRVGYTELVLFKTG